MSLVDDDADNDTTCDRLDLIGACCNFGLVQTRRELRSCTSAKTQMERVISQELVSSFHDERQVDTEGVTGVCVCAC